MKTLRFKISVDKESFTTINWRPFVFGLGAGMIMASLSYFGIDPFKSANATFLKKLPAQETAAQTKPITNTGDKSQIQFTNGKNKHPRTKVRGFLKG